MKMQSDSQLGDLGDHYITDPVWAAAKLHRKIRENLDPDKEFLSDADVQKVIRMHYGNESSIIRQCILGISLMAEEAGKMEIATAFRKLLFSFEAGNFDIHAQAEAEFAAEADAEAEIEKQARQEKQKE